MRGAGTLFGFLTHLNCTLTQVSLGWSPVLPADFIQTRSGRLLGLISLCVAWLLGSHGQLLTMSLLWPCLCRCVLICWCPFCAVHVRGNRSHHPAGWTTLWGGADRQMDSGRPVLSLWYQVQKVGFQSALASGRSSAPDTRLVDTWIWLLDTSRLSTRCRLIGLASTSFCASCK